MQLFVCDRWENYKGAIKTLASCIDTRELNGENSLEIVSFAVLDKGDRIVWRDLKGRWRENIVGSCDESHADTGVERTHYCPNSAIELRGDYIEDKRPGNCSAATALASALSSSRWTVGQVDDLGTAQVNFYHASAWQAIHDVANAFGGELRFDIAVSGSRVVSRRVSLLAHVGSDTGKRFTYSKDLSECRRTVSEDDVCTALYGWGASLETTDEDGNLTGGYSRKLSFADANGGVKWIGDDAARERWGRPDGKGGKAHVFGEATFDKCEDPAELLRLTRAELAVRSVPKVSYAASVAATRNAGVGFEGADEGDAVAVIDGDLGVRVMARINKVKEDQLEEENTTYEFGNFGDLADVFKAQKSAIRESSDSVASYAQNAVNASNAQTNRNMGALGDRFEQEVNEAIKHGDDQVAALKAEMDKIPSDIREQLIDMINEEVNTTGGWVYEEPGKGIFVYNSRPEYATKCVKIGGRIVAVANSKYSNGNWYFKTAMTGDGMVADRIYTGRITGGSSYFDLDSGVINMRNGIINITDTNGNTVTVSPSLGFQVRDKNGSMIAGTVIANGKAFFMSRAVGVSSSLYLTTGTTAAGNPGASFVNTHGNYFDVEALRAVSDSSGKTTGVGMACFDKPFLHASTFYKQLWLHPPYFDNTYLQQPNEQLFLRCGGNSIGETPLVKLQYSSTQGLFLGPGYVTLKLDDSHYVRISSDGVQCRCGSKGFGWLNGEFHQTLVW